MRMKFLLTALATVSLAGISTSVMAQGQTSFHPVESWKVNDMSGGNNPDNRCVLITEYNNGFYVQFQGTAGKIELLSINMRQDAFEAQSRMEVKMTIPGKPTVSMQAQAFDAQTLLVNMNGQDALFQNLRSASAFDVNVGGNNFRFFMTGFANSLPVFDQCMGTASPAPQAMMEPEVQPMEEPTVIVEPDMTEIAAIEEAPTMPAEAINVEAADTDTAISVETEAEALAPMPMTPVEEPIADPVIEAQDNVVTEPPPADLVEELSDFVSSPEPVVAPAPIVADNAPVMPMPGMDDPAAMTMAAEEQTNMAAMEPITMAEEAPQEIVAVQVAPEEIAPMEVVEAPAPKKLSLRERLMGKKQEEAPAVEAEAMQEEPAEVIQMSSPEMKVNRQVSEGEFDLTEAREVNPAQAIPPSFDNADTAELRKELEMLRSENEALNTELKLALRSGEKERLDVSSKNWNLETATMRYNEAERQVASLGQQVQKERAQCSFEKKELETMLFDPQMTNEAQLAHLAKLEKQLQETRAELETLRGTRAQ